MRNPASFNGVVGMRPSIGRVAHTPRSKIDGNLSQQGAMARNVEDLALLLDAMSGEHPADPASLPRPATSFLSSARSGWRPKRVAWSVDLGITKVDREVAAITRKAAERFAELGAVVEEAHPDLSETHDCFDVLRAYYFYVARAKLLRNHRDLLKPEVIWNIEKGGKTTMDELERAEAQRVALARRMLEFFGTYDLLLTPATVVGPFPIENRYVAELDGHKFANYIAWCAIAYAITLACCPAMSLPCGFTAENLPVGLADRRAAARRSAHPGGREGAGGYSRHPRHDADRSARRGGLTRALRPIWAHASFHECGSSRGGRCGSLLPRARAPRISQRSRLLWIVGSTKYARRVGGARRMSDAYTRPQASSALNGSCSTSRATVIDSWCLSTLKRASCGSNG